MRVRSSLIFALETQETCGAHIGEVGTLRMHVIVDAKNHDVVLPHEIDLRRVKRIAADEGDVVAIVPERVFVRNDHVEASGTGSLDDVERHEDGCRDAGDRGIGASNICMYRDTWYRAMARRDFS